MVLKRLVFILFLLKTPLAWGFSIEHTEKYLRIAQEKNLAEDPQWLRLGHYHRSWFGYESKIRGDFFLATNGSADPRAEIEATIRTLFSEASSRSQCRYLARTRWLQKVLDVPPNDLAACSDRADWKRRLNAREIYIIFAANDLNSAASSFGHTFLRLHDPAHLGSLDLIDYGVNFSAKTDNSDGALYVLKGLFGFYPGFYSMMPFHQKMREYVNLEGRDLWEYKLQLTPDQVDFIVDHLLELEGSYVPYYFLHDNCSYQLLELIEVARPDLQFSEQFRDATVPLDTLKVLNQEKDFLRDEKRRPSLKRSFQFGYRELESKQKDRVVALVRAIDRGEKPADLQSEDAPVLESGLAYADLQTFRGKTDLKEWRYRLALARAQKGPGSSLRPEPYPGSPLDGAATIAWQLGAFRRNEKNYGEFKFRRAFHDLLSRDEGVAPFSHMEFLSVTLQRPFDEGPLDLRDLKLLKIMSTLPVDRLEHPLSWKADVGTEDKFNPKLEGGVGFSFDIDRLSGGRWINLLIARAFRENEKDRMGAGAESLFVQKYTDRLRSSVGARYLGFANRGPLLEAEAALSFDASPKLETRLSVERIREQSEFHLRFIF